MGLPRVSLGGAVADKILADGLLYEHVKNQTSHNGIAKSALSHIQTKKLPAYEQL